MPPVSSRAPSGSDQISLPATPSTLPCWIRNPVFDGFLIGGSAVLALAAGIALVLKPALFWGSSGIPGLVHFNLWILGWHHVMGTYTRIAFDHDSFREHRYLVTGLPWILLAGVMGLVLLSGGPTLLITIYLYWQWFHYTRQSYGISQIYRRKAPGLGPVDEKLGHATLYLVALTGILFRSCQHTQDPRPFLRAQVWTLPVPEWAVWATGIAAAGCLLAWAVAQFRRYRRREASSGYTLFMVTHVLIFTTGYLLIEDMSHGWLVLNVWHNAQYILLVWSYNNSRFKNGTHPRHRFLSTLSRRRFAPAYFLVCLVGGVIFFFLVSLLCYAAEKNQLLPAVTGLGVPLIVLAYQTINFHHYIVDAVIWKLRKPDVRDTLQVGAH